MTQRNPTQRDVYRRELKLAIDAAKAKLTKAADEDCDEEVLDQLTAEITILVMKLESLPE